MARNAERKTMVDSRRCRYRDGGGCAIEWLGCLAAAPEALVWVGRGLRAICHRASLFNSAKTKKPVWYYGYYASACSFHRRRRRRRCRRTTTTTRVSAWIPIPNIFKSSEWSFGARIEAGLKIADGKGSALRGAAGLRLCVSHLQRALSLTRSLFPSRSAAIKTRTIITERAAAESDQAASRL